MGEVVRRTGLSRQWVSRMAALGAIPGASRKPSGRWEFSESKKLEDWLDDTRRRTRIRMQRRALHQDEAELRRLERKRAKLRTSPLARNAKRRLAELNAEIAIKRAAVRDYLNARQVAEATGRSRRWVTGQARSIPGARMLHNHFVFPKSHALSEWIHRERRIRDLERRMLPGDIRIPRSPIATVLFQTFRYERIVLREFSMLPLSEWPANARDEFAKDFSHMANEIRRAAGLIDAG